MDNKGMISTKQSVLLFLCLAFSQITSTMLHSSVFYAKQTAYIAPLIAAMIASGFFFFIFPLWKRYQGSSFAGISYKILGSPIGKGVMILYFFWFVFLTSYFIRNCDEKLLTTMYTHENTSYFIIVVLILSAIILRKGIYVIARMNQITFSIIVTLLVLILCLLLPQLSIKNLTPISRLDILPILRGVPAVLSTISYLFFLFLIGNEITVTGPIQRSWGLALFIFTFAAVWILATIIGLFGHGVAKELVWPLLSAVKQVFESKSFSGMESFFLSIWLFSDFISIAFLVYLALSLLKSIFGLTDPMSLLYIYLLFLFFTSRYLVKNLFELQYIGRIIISGGNILFGFLLPFLIYIVGKCRKLI